MQTGSLPDQRRQFRVLYRDFLFRIVDLEIISSRGDIRNLLIQLAAMLAALSLTMALLFVPRYAYSTLSHGKLMMAAWGDEEFLIATTIAVAGLFGVLAWNTLFPDRRDSLVLGPLPVRLRTMFLAKAAAIGTGLGISIFAVNVCTGLAYPTVFVPPHGGLLALVRPLCGYWLTMFGAGLWVFCSLVAVQGLASQMLPYRVFLRASSLLQLTALFIVLGLFFLTPAPGGVLANPNHPLVNVLPSYWFLGLFQKLNGSNNPMFGELAWVAMRNMGIALAVASVTYALAWIRNIRNIVEQPDITPGDRKRPASRIGAFLAAKLITKPLERAIVMFTARTIARSRQHRLVLAAYGGSGLAIALVYSKELIFVSVNPGSVHASWTQVSTAALMVSLVPLCFAVVGMRAVFALPISLSANWVFRITAVHRPASYFAATRKAMFAFTAVPIWIAAAVLYASLWPARPVLEHMAILVAFGVLLIEMALRQFRKIPFTCSYLPGKGASRKVVLAAYAIGFLLLSHAGVAIELWSMERPKRFAVVLGILVLAAALAWRRRAEFAGMAHHRIQFEEFPPADVLVLDLRKDGAWTADESYVDAI